MTFIMAQTKKKTASKKSASKKSAQKSTQTNVMPVYIITTGLLALFLGIFMYVDTGSGGIINEAIRSFFCGMFGRMGMLFPLICLGLMIYMSKTRSVKRFWIKALLSVLALLNTSAIAGLMAKGTVDTAFALGAYELSGGGLLGTGVAVFMTSLFQQAASYIILIITLILLASFISGVSLFGLMGRQLKKLMGNAGGKYSEFKDKYADMREERKKEKIPEAVSVANDFAAEMNRAPSGIKFEAPEDNELPAPKRRRKASPKKEAESDELPFNDAETTEIAESNGIDEVFAKLSDKTPKTETSAEAAAQKQEKAKKRADSITEAEEKEFHDELDSALAVPAKEYVYPPIELLDPPKKASGDIRDELRTTAEKLIRVLDDFGVKAKLLQVTQGPSVTRFEIQPDTGIKLSKISGLADDIALNLAVSTVLVAPVQGKAAVGIEIPNNSISAVTIREMLESSKFKSAKSKLTVALGKDIGGNVVVADIAKMPHVLIAGATGSGKSVCVNAIITSLLYKSSPDEVKLILIDPKVVELGVYNGIPHLLIPVVTDPKKAAGALNWAVSEMMRRYDLFKNTGVRKLESYNELMESRGEEKIPQLVIIIDELADLMMVAAKEVEDYICRLAQLARAAGIHLIIATQRPSVDVITGLIKANIPSRIAFAVSSQIDSRTILNKGGAEKLLGRGDMLYSPMGAMETTRIQGAFVTDRETERIVDFVKENSEENHYSEELEEHIERCATGENGVTPDTEEEGDALLPDAIGLAVELGKISTSMIQRRLGVGYARAGRIVDQMEARGIVSAANGSKPRDVLIGHADLAAVTGGAGTPPEDGGEF